MSRFWKIALIVIALIVVAAIGFRLLHKPTAEGAHRAVPAQNPAASPSRRESLAAT